MGRRGPKRKLDETELLDAALRLVHHDGLEALTIGALARTLSVSASGLYRYFESKGDLVVALQLRAIRGYDERARAALDSVEPPAEGARRAWSIERLRRAWRTWIEAAVEFPAEHRLIDAFLSAPQPVLTAEQALEVDRHLEPLLDRLDRAHDDAVATGALEPGPARERSYLIWAALHGLDHFRKRDRIQPPELRTDHLFDAMFITLLRGFGYVEPTAV